LDRHFIQKNESDLSMSNGGKSHMPFPQGMDMNNGINPTNSKQFQQNMNMANAQYFQNPLMMQQMNAMNHQMQSSISFQQQQQQQRLLQQQQFMHQQQLQQAAAAQAQAQAQTQPHRVSPPVEHVRFFYTK
jgi:hypothetical protein